MIGIRQFLGNTHGNVALTVGLLLPVLVGFSALATDYGSAVLKRRTLQAATDAAALAVVQQPENARILADEVLAKFGFENVVLRLTPGRLDRTLHRDDRFVPMETFDNAYRVEAQVKHHYVLASTLGIKETSISTHSDAARDPIISFTAGSRLASLDPEVLNRFLLDTLGEELSLSVADYDWLAKAKLPLGSILQAAGVSDPAATDRMQLSLRLSDLLRHLSRAADGDGQSLTSSILLKLTNSRLAATSDVRLADIVNMNEGALGISRAAAQSALSADIVLLDILKASIGANTESLIVESDVSAPGLARLAIETFIGEGLRTAIGPVGTSTETGQIRLRLKAATANVLALLGVGVTIPIEAVVAGGRATVVSASCNAADRQVTVEVAPGLARLSLGEWFRPLSEARISDRLPPTALVRAPLARIDGQANLAIARMDATTLSFNAKEIAAGVVKTTRTRDFLSSPIQSLFRATRLDIRLAGLSLGTSIVASALQELLASVVEPLDRVLENSLALAGVGLGEIDVRVNDLQCGAARLVG